MVNKQCERLADRLLERARDDDDVKTAAVLRRLGRVYDVAFEVVRARTHEQSKAAYAELVDLMRGKAE